MRWLTIILAYMAVCLAAGCVASPGFSGVVAVRANHNFGSGVVVAHDAHGYLVATAAHVVHGDRRPLIDTEVGQVVAAGKNMDVALVRVDDVGQGYRVMRLTRRIRQGQPITALGYTTRDNETYPLCYRGYLTATRWPGGVIVANCGIFLGMSGGPALDGQGRVIGILMGCQGLGGCIWETCTMIVPTWAIESLMRHT